MEVLKLLHFVYVHIYIFFSEKMSVSFMSTIKSVTKEGLSTSGFILKPFQKCLT